MRILRHFITMITLLAAMLFSACNDWLDVTPEVNIKDGDLLSTEDGYFDALFGVYGLMTSPALYGDQLTLGFLDVLACNYSIDTKASEAYYRGIHYDYRNTHTRHLIDGIWGGMYEAIANVNNILEHLNRVDTAIFHDNNYSVIKGEALALRAVLHFDLARMFGPVPKQDAGKVFMPYVKKISKDNTLYSNLDDVLDSVKSDLLEAEGLLADDPVRDNGYDTHNTYLLFRRDHLNYYAVLGMLARVNLYSGDRVQARAYAEKLLTGQQQVRLLNSTAELDKDRLFSQEILFSLFVDNIGKISDGYFLPKAEEKGELKLAETNLMAMFEAEKYDKKDVRYEYLFEDMEGCPRLIKYRQLSSDRPSSRCRVPMLKISEMYYISAECSQSVDSAQLRINQVRTARRLPNLEFQNMIEVQNYLQQEYRREFYAEGQLFFYYKRLDVQSIPDSEVSISGKTSEAYVFPLPDREIEYGNK